MIVLGLGSNVGDRAAQLRRAVTLLTRGEDACLTEVQCSAVYENPALVPDGAPAEWDQPFYNMVVRGETSYLANELLARIKQVEKKVGRQERDFWGPREIDIDILVMDDVTLQSEALTIPHKGLLKRDFFLVPLADVAPEWCYPGTQSPGGQTAAELMQAVDCSSMRKVMDAGEVLQHA